MSDLSTGRQSSETTIKSGQAEQSAKDTKEQETKKKKTRYRFVPFIFQLKN